MQLQGNSYQIATGYLGSVNVNQGILKACSYVGGLHESRAYPIIGIDNLSRSRWAVEDQRVLQISDRVYKIYSSVGFGDSPFAIGAQSDRKFIAGWGCWKLCGTCSNVKTTNPVGNVRDCHCS